MPWVDEKGLLPGRGPAGLGAGGRGTADVDGALPPSAAGCPTGATGADGCADAAGASTAGAGDGVAAAGVAVGGAITDGGVTASVALRFGDSA